VSLQDETDDRNFAFLTLRLSHEGRGRADFEGLDCVLVCVRVRPAAPSDPPLEATMPAQDGGGVARQWTAGGRGDAGRDAGSGREFLGVVVERLDGGQLRLKVSKAAGPFRMTPRPAAGGPLLLVPVATGTNPSSLALADTWHTMAFLSSPPCFLEQPA
jgi:hypothetical protein